MYALEGYGRQQAYRLKTCTWEYVRQHNGPGWSRTLLKRRVEAIGDYGRVSVEELDEWISDNLARGVIGPFRSMSFIG
ncbi:MAG: hypothetical protein ACRDU5_20790 [Mycobacterium sp.]